MAALCPASVQYLSQACQGKVKSSKNGIILDAGNGKKVNGIPCIAKHHQRTSDHFKDLSLEERMAVEQWLEYRLYIDGVRDGESEKMILQELSRYLEDKVYFVAHQLTVADILLYHSLHPLFSKLTFQEKEKFMNVSRWFNNVQQDQRSRQMLPALPFIRTPLYDGASSH